MKRTPSCLTFLLQAVMLIILCLPVSGQEYVHFPAGDARWHIYLESTCDNDSPAIPELLRYFLEGDTLIGEVLYNRLYVESGDTVSPAKRLSGIIREEDKRVYYIGSGFTDPFDGEHLLYDFNAQVGDTIYHNDDRKSIVLEIDSAAIGGVFRKRYLVDNGWYFHNPDLIIEGIGSVLNGLLGHISVIPTCGSHYWEHVCFYDRGEMVYRNPAYPGCYGGVYLDTALHADAGSDLAVCSGTGPHSLGGYPAAMGGTPPYTYTWSATYEVAHRDYPASFMLEDTTVSNPVFREGAMPDSAVFYLAVTDGNGNTATDAVLVRESRYVACLADCRYDIDPGDSVQLWHCVTGGIPPLQFTWEPAGTLSDPAAADPWAKPVANTTYQLTITDSFGCIATSTCKVFINPSGMEVEEPGQEFRVYPNPAGEMLVIEFSRLPDKDTRLEILNTSGQSIRDIPVHGSSVSVDTREMSPGIYILFVKSAREVLDKGMIVVE